MAPLSPRRLVMHPDTYARHAVAARLVGDAASILDVGGAHDRLAAFLPRRRVMTANVEPPADLVFDGRTLPVPDASFAAATSLDVLEHLTRPARLAHVTELVRISRGRVVVCCPLGTPAHIDAERELAAWYEGVAGAPHPRLQQHIVHGLPTEDELRELAAAAGLEAQLFFQGDFRRVQELFRLAARARVSRATLPRYAVRRLVTRPELALATAPTAYTNRAFLVGAVATTRRGRSAPAQS